MTTHPSQPVLVPVGSRAGARDPEAAGRDPVHLVYEQAAGLLASAGALRAAAHTPGIAAALGPTLACLEASLDALADVSVELGRQAVAPDSGPGAARPGVDRIGPEVEQRFRRLVDALEHAGATCANARVAVGPVETCARTTQSLHALAPLPSAHGVTRTG